MIEYSDLVEINKALAKLVAEADTDCSANPDYLETALSPMTVLKSATMFPTARPTGI